MIYLWSSEIAIQTSDSNTNTWVHLSAKFIKLVLNFSHLATSPGKWRPNEWYWTQNGSSSSGFKITKKVSKKTKFSLHIRLKMRSDLMTNIGSSLLTRQIDREWNQKRIPSHYAKKDWYINFYLYLWFETLFKKADNSVLGKLSLICPLPSLCPLLNPLNHN